MKNNFNNELFLLAKDTKLFQPYWYMKQSGLLFDTEEEAFADYLRKSKFSMVNPSKYFDPLLYLLINQDVDSNEVSALEHYLNHGKIENRPIYKQRNFPKLDTTCYFNHKLSEKAKQLKVAITFHIYYVDFIEKFSEALADFPVEYDLYITMNNEEYKEKAIHVFSKNKMLQKIECKIAPNKGRNFGPLLVEYSKELQEYDLFAHLHSKKSLYSGKEQTQWADYVLEYLLNEKQVIVGMLNLFAKNKDIGMYYPTTFWGLPYWANHWLKNYHLAKALYPECEISNTFIAYPASGMFWARPDAIKQILDKDYTYEDFPDEPLANDGTMLHVIERIIASYCEYNNYKQLFFYPSLGQFSTDKKFIIETYYNDNFDSLKANISSVDTISLDLFDTLFIRKYHFADYAKKLLGDELAKQGIVKSSKEFVEIRNNAELEIRKEKNFIGDVSIEEVYAKLATILDISFEKSTYLMEREFEIDLDMIVPRKKMVDLVNGMVQDGKELFFITDIYYTKKQIEKLISFCGIRVPYGLYVSSDNGLRKDNGSVWEFLRKEAIVNTASHLHIGDNAVSDCQVAGDFGFRSIHILNPLDKWKIMGYPIENEENIIYDDEKIKFIGSLISKNALSPFFKKDI